MKRNNPRATIKDVALAAGVSPMTVSNVLNGHKQYVGKKTRERVEREIERLQYRRQANARNLRVSQQRSIGMIIFDDSPYFLADIFTAQVVAGLTNFLNMADFTVTIQGIRHEELKQSVLARNLEVAGFCVMLSGPEQVRQDNINELACLNQPAVLIQEAQAHSNPDFSVVRQDDFCGGSLIADHLSARKVSSYLVIVPLRAWPAVEQRIAGLKYTLNQTSPDATISIIHARTEGFDDVQNAIANHLETNPLPEAIIGANDLIATAAMLHLLDRGVSIPQDTRIVGFNGFESHNYTRPAITTIISSPYDIGESAARLMLERLESGSFEKQEHVIPVHFKPGGTT